jgi:hypothetical protein
MKRMRIDARGASRIARTARLAFLLTIALAASPAQAGPCQPPVPELSVVPKAIPISPDGSLTYTVRIIQCNGPVNASRVNVLFNTVGDSLVCWCNSSPWVPGAPHSFFATTNASGIATFNIVGGGCVENQLAAIPGNLNYAAEVFADFVKLAECGVVSPDAVDSAGRLSTDVPVWNPAGSCATGLSDAVFQTVALATSTYRWCTDINGDVAVTLSDGVILTPYLAAATTCAGNAGY